MPMVKLTLSSNTKDIGSSINLTCISSLSDASQYNGANMNFQYQYQSSVFHNKNKTISGGTLPTDSTELMVNTSSAGTYTCTVTINGHGSPTITGSSESGQDTAQLIVRSKYPSKL